MKTTQPGKIQPMFYFMVLPMVILFFALHTVPFLQGVFYSFTDWKGYGDWSFVGLRNYLQLFQDPNVAGAYGFTIKFTLWATVLVNVLSLAIACALNANVRFKNLLKAVYFLPYMLGTLIVSYVFKYIFSNLLPEFGKALNIPFLSANLLGSSSAWVAVLFVTVWQSLAFNTMIYLSGLQTVDRSIYEAADLDGVTGLKRFLKITFPMIAPFFTINMVLCGKSFLMAFDQIIAMTNGGPGVTTQTIAVLIYKRGFNGGQFAYQSANAVMLFIMVVVISVFQLRVLERREKKYE